VKHDSSQQDPGSAELAAVADLYHSFLTGLLVALLVRRPEEEVEELVFRLFRKKHLEQFLPGLEKLGLRDNGQNLLPDAVVCAQYHYLSNFLGGVGVEFIAESDRKSWVRYPPPRWIWQGVAIAAIPSAVSAAMLRGWHAHNGVTLGNPRLGFVCTGQTVDGQPGLEGYYYEYDQELKEGERLRFAPGEQAPPFDPALAPSVPSADWPRERLDKANRNYSMDYVATLLPLMLDLLGVETALPIACHTARVIALQSYSALRTAIDPAGALGFPQVFAALARAQGDSAAVTTESAPLIQQSGWRLFARPGQSLAMSEGHAQACFEIWNELWLGCALAHDRFRRLEAVSVDLERLEFSWRFSSQ
jgi:hypothetical protein